jgi:hypothetical protein
MAPGYFKAAVGSDEMITQVTGELIARYIRNTRLQIGMLFIENNKLDFTVKAIFRPEFKLRLKGPIRMRLKFSTSSTLQVVY